MPRDAGALVHPAAVRCIAQHRVEFAAGGKLPQRAAQQLGLSGQRRVIEVQVDLARRHGLLVDALVPRHRRFAHEGAAADLAADKAHGFEFGIDARGRHQREAVALGQPPVRGQPGAGLQPARADLGGEFIDQLLVAGFGHRAMYP